LDEIPDPVFPVPWDTNFKLPYANWKGKFKNVLKYGEDFGKYQKFFESGAPKTTDEDLITGKIGTHTVTIKDLKTLAAGTWLNDTIIDRTTDLPASMCAEYNALKKTDRKVAVFDSRFTSLIIKKPKNSDPPRYNYSRMVGFGSRRLHDMSPLSFECLVFPNNIYDMHWNIIVVFPKQSLIVAVDSMTGGRPVASARTVFRWLYDETKYNWPADKNDKFSSHQPDMGWGFRVDNKVSHQMDVV
jgi:hypothetical protein